MIVYVRIPRLRNHGDYLKLAELLSERKFDDSVEYNNGGWMDYEIGTVSPHLKFYSESDALAYVLAFGGEVFHRIPHVED
jgi:hypothetical protein